MAALQIAKIIQTNVLLMASKLHNKKTSTKAQNFLHFSNGLIHKGKIGIMTAKAKIKVIKKNEIKSVETSPKIEKKSKQEAAREMVSTVTNWVNEFQHRKREETKKAFENFLSSKTQTNSV